MSLKVICTALTVTRYYERLKEHFNNRSTLLMDLLLLDKNYMLVIGCPGLSHHFTKPQV